MRSWYCLLALLFIVSISLAQDQIATLPDGRKVVLHPDKTWEYYTASPQRLQGEASLSGGIPSYLRGGITVDQQTLAVAIEMHKQGWRYTMPVPKSTQAAWGNSDGRTTWWYGYWYNVNSDKYSDKTPTKSANGMYYGDGQNNKAFYRNGGTPPTPSKLEWLLSESGGVKPK